MVPRESRSRRQWLEQTGNREHRDWRRSIMEQLQHRKVIEQAPFEDIYSYASGMFDKVDIYKSENIQLNLQREQLQQQLLGIQQTLLAGGTVAAKTILSKICNTSPNEGTPSVSTETTSLLAEKCQLEKKILDLQEKLADALKSKSDTVQKIIDLKTELEEKDSMNKKSTLLIEEKDKQIIVLKAKVDKLDQQLKTLTDEHLALSLSYKGLEKKKHYLEIQCDAMRAEILAEKHEKAERLNAENDRIDMLQQERLRKEREATMARLDKVPLGPSDGTNISENFDILDDDDSIVSLNAPSRIPSDIEFTFDAHEGEACTANWFSCSGPRDHYLATGGSDRKVKLWKISDGTSANVATLIGSNASITSIDVEGDSILASSNDHAIRAWSVTNYKQKATMTGHSARVLSAKFLGVPNKVASGSNDRTVKIWDVPRSACFKTYFSGSTCNDLVYSDCQIITGHVDSKVRCWDLRRPNENEPTGHIFLHNKIYSLDISRDGTKLLCLLKDNIIKCLDLRKMEVLHTYLDEKFKIGNESYRAKFSVDGQLISCGTKDGGLFIWNTNNMKLEKILVGHNHPLFASCWSPDGKRMCSIGKTVSIWA